MVISRDADNGFLALITFSAEDTDTDTDTGNLHTHILVLNIKVKLNVGISHWKFCNKALFVGNECCHMG